MYFGKWKSVWINVCICSFGACTDCVYSCDSTAIEASIGAATATVAAVVIVDVVQVEGYKTHKANRCAHKNTNKKNAQLNVCQHVNRMWAEAQRARIPPHSTGDSTCTRRISNKKYEWTNEGRRRRSNGGRKEEKKENTNKSRHTHQRARVLTKPTRAYYVAIENYLVVDITLFNAENRAFVVNQIVFFFSYSANVCWGGECERESTNYTRKKNTKTFNEWAVNQRRTMEWREDQREEEKNSNCWKECGLKSFFSLHFCGYIACECVSGQHVCLNDEFECRIAFDGRTKSHIHKHTIVDT